MQNKEIKIGSFVRLKKPHYLKGVFEETASYKANSFMFFFGSPQRFQTINKNDLNLNEFEELLKKYQIKRENIIVHLPYLINLANYENNKVLNNSKLLMKRNFELCDHLKIKNVVLHPGSALKNDRKFCLQKISKNLDEILKMFPNITVCLETMSGKGSELGKNFDELKTIIQGSKYSNQIAVCFDLCHLYSAGYDLTNNWEKILEEFDLKIGLKKLIFCHVNDSKTPLNSNKDFHSNIGDGEIGFATIHKIVHHPKMKNTTMILETPYIDKKPPYKEEIALLKKNYDQK